MSPATAYRTTRPRTFTLPCGPFLGMRDSIDPTSARPELAQLLRNVYPRDPGQSSSVVGRPGFDQIGAQLGSGGDVQYIGQYTEEGGTEHTIAIVGGKFYTLDWGTATWTEVLTAANLSSASITLSATARVYAVPFAREIVFTDGVNTPWSWDGTLNGGLTKLTNAPVAFGKPAVYYGKLFFIKSTERSTFVWSEENQPNAGYEAGGYNNAWTLSQTDPDPLTALIGTNSALYVFRAYSTTLVVGEATDNFASTGTIDGVSETVGTSSPASVFATGSDIFFADSHGRPHVIKPGSGAVAIWQDFDQTISNSYDVGSFDVIEGYYNPTLELSVLAYVEQGEADRSSQLCYRTTGFTLPQAAAVFDGYTFTRIGVVKNGTGEPRVMHGSTDGYLYVHGTPLGAVWEDGLNAGDAAIEHEVRTNIVAYSTTTESHFVRADFVSQVQSDTEITVRASTNAGLSSSTSVTLDATSAEWDSAVWDVDVWADIETQHGAVGLNSFGPYCSLWFTHSSGSERFQFVSGSIEGRPVSRYPEMR